MFKIKKVLGVLLVFGVSGLVWAEEASKGTESLKVIGTQATRESQGTEIEALGPTKAVSSIMQGLGKVGEKHKVLFIEVLEENYDTFLPGLLVKRKWVYPYFKFDKKEKKIVIETRVVRDCSPNMLNAQGKIRENVSLIVKHTLDYKGIGRRYPRYYIYEVSQLPAVINLTTLKALYEEQIRFVDDLKITDLSLDGKVRFIYDKEKIWLKPGDLWKAEKRSKSIPIESDKYIKEQFDWLNKVSEMDGEITSWLKVRKEKSFGKGISDKDLEALREGKVTFSTEVTILNHGIVEVETYRRGLK